MAKCNDCGEPLKYAHEVAQGSLCGACGPGSAKMQAAMRAAHHKGQVPLSAITAMGGEIPPGTIAPGQTLREDVDPGVPDAVAQGRAILAPSEVAGVALPSLSVVMQELAEAKTAITRLEMKVDMLSSLFKITPISTGVLASDSSPPSNGEGRKV